MVRLHKTSFAACWLLWALWAMPAAAQSKCGEAARPITEGSNANGSSSLREALRAQTPEQRAERQKKRERSRFLKSRPRSQTVTRYFRNGEFIGGQRERLIEKDGFFTQNNRVENVDTNDPHSNPMTDQQRFPMAIMAETGYLTPEQARDYSRLVFQLHENQVVFFETQREVPLSWARREYGDKFETRYDQFSGRPYGETTVNVRTSSLWAVSGQVLDAKSSMVRSVPLPWQLEPAKRELSDKYFDRRKYRIVFEWGRGAQEMSGENDPLRAMAAAANYHEVRALNGKLEDAYVMLHSLDAVNSQLYLQKHPGSLFPPGHKDMNDALFLVPLAEMLQKYPPSSVSLKLKALIDASGGKLTEAQAIELHNEFRDLHWMEMDLKVGSGRQPTPIVVNDYSRGREYLFTKLLKRFGFTGDFNQKMKRYLDHLDLQHATWNKGQYTDLTDRESMYRDMVARQAVDASNLSVREAQADSKYTLRVLFSLFIYYAHRLAAPEITQATLDHAVAMMRGEGIRFSISTFEPVISQQLQKYGPEYFTYQIEVDRSLVPDAYRPEQARDFQGHGHDYWTKIYEKPLRAHVFTADDVVQLMRR
ncbi:MAG TPA: hypothetical protein VFV50_09085, partial [Bdellovibrionales bacterium]|nr:hypothetical protein [Bdellovibrionales bacterium]